MPSPKLSIITINLNNKVGLVKTIQSVAEQTFTDFEYIVIDGASNDGSIKVIQQYEDCIDYWVSEPDKGIYFAMNKGIDQATGDYLLFLNSGDWLYEDSVFNRFVASNPKEDILYGNSLFVKDGKVVQKKIYPSYLKGMELTYWTVNHQAIFFHKSLFDENNRYNTKYKLLADWVFYMDAIFKQNASYKRLSFPIVYYDITGITSFEDNLSKMQEEKLQYYIENPDIFIPHFLEEYHKLKIKLNEFEHRKLKNCLKRTFQNLSKWKTK